MIWVLGYWVFALCILILVMGMLASMLDDFGFWAIIAGLAWLLFWFAAAYGGYDEIFGNHPTFELRKDRWACTARHTQVVSTPISDGKGGTTYSTSSYTICDQYSRIAE